MPKHNPFTGLLPDEISTELSSEPSYRGKQIFKAIQSGNLTFQEITTLSKPFRTWLEKKFTLTSTSLLQTLTDADGTIKQQIQLSSDGTGGTSIEAVLLTDRDRRKTACLSTQAGCAMGCSFCRTGQLALSRNLNAAEIVEQFHHLGRPLSQGETISNIVFMGMGEPLDNLEMVRKAISVLHHPDGANIGLRRITLSTCGIVEGIVDLADNGPDVRLAVSLNSGDEEIRRSLMPISSTNPLHELKRALLHYQTQRKKRITFEYVLLKGINDRKDDVKLLSAYLKGLKGVVNLIPYNQVEGADFESPGQKEIQNFLSHLEEAAIPVVQRFRRGGGINGACGQLGIISREPPESV